MEEYNYDCVSKKEYETFMVSNITSNNNYELNIMEELTDKLGEDTNYMDENIIMMFMEVVDENG